MIYNYSTKYNNSIFINKMKHIIIFNLSIITLLLIFGCEDDAILKPQNESDCTGSYCSLNLPDFNNKNKNINPSIF